MIFFLFITFITVSGVHVDHTAQLQSLLSTDPASVDQIFDMIAKLRRDNNETITKVTGENEAAIQALETAKSTLAAAITAEEAARGKFRDASNHLKDLQSIEDEAETVEKDASNKRDIAQHTSDTADAFLVSENARIDSEKKTCEEIIVLLSKLSATANKEFLEIAQNNRRLLSVIDLSDLAGADPDAVQQVEDMINDLIDAGEDERQKVKEAALAAAEVLKAAIKVHEEKLNALFWAAGEVEVYTEKVDDLETKAAAATKATASAQNTHDLAVIHQDTTQESFDFETDRVKGEEEIFVEVTRLLNTLK